MHTYDFDCDNCFSTNLEADGIQIELSGDSIRLHVHLDYKVIGIGGNQKLVFGLFAIGLAHTF